MVRLMMTLYATCCGLGFLLVSVFLGVTLFFLFVTLVAVVSDALDHRLRQNRRRPLAGAV